jgi:vacuolar-type H+-ATPase subunit E/Vma4
VGLEDVKHAILEKTRAEVAAIIESGDAEAKRILQEAQQQVDHKRKEHEQETERIVDSLERQEHARAQFVRKGILLEEKRKALDTVFASAKDQLTNMNATQRANMLKTLAQKARDSIAVQKCLCNSKDVATLKKEFPEATVEANDTIIGGFKAQDKNGVVSVDYTYESIMEAVRERYAAELAEKLFS